MAAVPLVAGAVAALAAASFAAVVLLRRSGTEVSSSAEENFEVEYPSRGSVGAGDVEQLTELSPPGGVLVVQDDDFELRDVYVRGGVDHQGSGTLTIRNSIVEGGYGWDRHVQGGTIDVADSTIRSVDGFVPASVGAINGQSVTARRNDISGTVDGFHVRSGSTLEENWVHDLRAGIDGHVDAVQLFEGSDIVIRDNRLELYPPGHEDHLDSTLHNASVWIAPWRAGWSVGDVSIEGNFLYGGVFTFKTDTTLAADVAVTGVRVVDNVFGPYPSGGYYGSVHGADPIVEFSGNVAGDDQGVPLQPARPVPAFRAEA